MLAVEMVGDANRIQIVPRSLKGSGAAPSLSKRASVLQKKVQKLGGWGGWNPHPPWLGYICPPYIRSVNPTP